MKLSEELALRLSLALFIWNFFNKSKELKIGNMSNAYEILNEFLARRESLL